MITFRFKSIFKFWMIRITSLWWPQTRRTIAKNVTEHPITSSQWLVQQVGLSHALTYCTLCFITYLYKILIHRELKPGDSTKIAETYRRLHRYTCGDVSVFDTFFFSNEAWLHSDGYINTQNYPVWSSENPHKSHPKKIGIWGAMRRKHVVRPIFLLDSNYCRGIPRYYSAIYCTFV